MKFSIYYFAVCLGSPHSCVHASTFFFFSVCLCAILCNQFTQYIWMLLWGLLLLPYYLPSVSHCHCPWYCLFRSCKLSYHSFCIRLINLITFLCFSDESLWSFLGIYTLCWAIKKFYCRKICSCVRPSCLSQRRKKRQIVSFSMNTNIYK